MLSACRCTFKREQEDPWEDGIAVTMGFGGSDVAVIIPDDATTPIDVLKDAWTFRLDWTHAIDGDSLALAHEKAKQDYESK